MVRALSALRRREAAAPPADPPPPTPSEALLAEIRDLLAKTAPGAAS
jgi:large conductance mechanosensitive channel